MANLSGNAPKDTYQSLLKLESNGMPAGSTLKTVEAGNGDATGLELSDSEVRATDKLTAGGATHLASTLRVDDDVTLNSVGASTDDVNALFVDANGVVVQRELHANAFDGQDATNSFSTITATGQSNVTSTAPNETLNLVAGNGINFVTSNATDNKSITIDTTGLFQNPMIIAKPPNDSAISTSALTKVPLSGVNNTTSDSSFGIKVGSEFAIDTSDNEIDVTNAGVFKIDVCLSITINTTDNEARFAVELIQEDSSGNGVDAFAVNEYYPQLPSSAVKRSISFSATRVFTANSHVYVKIQEISQNAGNTYQLLADSTIKIEKIAS